MLRTILCNCCGEPLTCCENPLRFYDVGEDRIATCIICGVSFQETLPTKGGEFRIAGERALFGLRRLVI